MSIIYNTSIEFRYLLHLLLLSLFCLINHDIVTNLNVFGELINWNSLVAKVTHVNQAHASSVIVTDKH